MAPPLPVSQTPSPGSRNTGLLSVPGMTLALCRCPTRTGSLPLPHHSMAPGLSIWPTGCLLSGLPAPCLPSGTQGTAHPPALHSLVVSSPRTFSLLLLQPPKAMATLGPCHLLGDGMFCAGILTLWPQAPIFLLHHLGAPTSPVFHCISVTLHLFSSLVQPVPIAWLAPNTLELWPCIWQKPNSGTAQLSAGLGTAEHF